MVRGGIQVHSSPLECGQEAIGRHDLLDQPLRSIS